MSMDLGGKFDEFNETEDDEEEALKTVLQELGLGSLYIILLILFHKPQKQLIMNFLFFFLCNSGGRPKKDGKGLSQPEKSVSLFSKASKEKVGGSAFGSRLPTKKRELRSQESTPRPASHTKHRRKKKEAKIRPPSVARLRMQSRQRRTESEMPIAEEQSEAGGENN